jgi:hypothetical protein
MKIIGGGKELAMEDSYKEYAVAYLDILGFSDMVERSLKDQTEIKKIADVLKRLQEHVKGIGIGEEPFPKATARMFSDTIVLSCPSQGFSTLASIIANTAVLQCLLVDMGQLLRGSIAVGSHCEDGDVMYGPALIEAYKSEGLAVWPRISIHPSALRLADKLDGRIEGLVEMGLLARSSDGQTYINYLHLVFSRHVLDACLSDLGVPHAPHPSLCEFLEGHKSTILGAVARAEKSRERMKLLSRLHSLAVYHNEFADVMGSVFPDEFNLQEIERAPMLHRIYNGLRFALESAVLREGKMAVPAETIEAANKAIKSILDSRMSQLCASKEAIKSNTIDISGVFPSLY